MSPFRRFSSRSARFLSPLLSTEEVQTLLQTSKDRYVRFLDASWYLDKSRDAKKEFALERLPGAQFFDIEQISDVKSTLPHMLPHCTARESQWGLKRAIAETFEHALMYLGVEQDDLVVIYGGPNCFSPARCWWTFKYFGHDSVHILNGKLTTTIRKLLQQIDGEIVNDGGITKWKKEERPVETGEPQKVVAGASYKAKPNEALVVSWEDVLAKIGSDTQIVDARGASRFYAKEPEPRPGMRGGHIPGSINVPFGKIVDPKDFSLFRDVAEIKSAFDEANVKMDETSPIITSCGSGVTASILTFGLHLAGKPLEKAPVYDGSWSEWGLRSDLPIETEANNIHVKVKKKETGRSQKFAAKSDLREMWDFIRAALQNLETYEAVLETSELPCLLLTTLEELLEAPETNATQLQEVVDICAENDVMNHWISVLQMIEFPIDRKLPQKTITTLVSTREWAIQTLLNVQVAQADGKKEGLLQELMTSKALQQMQSKLFVSAPCRDADVEMELHQLLLVAVEYEDESATLSEILEICAAKLPNDTQFLQFAETALSGKSETLTLGSVFLQRLFDWQARQSHANGQMIEDKVRHGQRLFDELTLGSRIAVWANHLPSWRSQLQTWMLACHRAPFEPISSVLPDGWWPKDGWRAGTNSVVAACYRYSHLYVTFIEWCRCHVDLLSSCRSMELVNVLSRSMRQENAACLFNRQLLSHVPMVDYAPGNWPCDQRERAFLTLGTSLERLQKTRSASDVVWQYEWIGVLERSYLLHEALELTFHGDTDRDMDDKINKGQSAARSSVHFFSWFYSFLYSESADEIASLLMTTSSELKELDIRSGALWLRRSRADFSILPIVRLRLVWFWLLKSIEAELQMPVSVIGEGTISVATTDVLESVEYIFRRFTPPRIKRPFQVEFVTQLLVELEWRATKTKTKDKFLNAIEPVWAWLTKIVRLMQLEEQTAHQKDSRNNYGSRRNAANDVEHLARRMEQLAP
ncbi:hypothetical protein DD238_002934 [Peronospora effusa]|uniref:Sulfurtransferase n=1 Tax=Peronospora effusa TaxID=542832 RepID=A0A3M6VSR7_9STRA|nr:hypothetical protein DD238_002934 [Peronospora effusa]